MKNVLSAVLGMAVLAMSPALQAAYPEKPIQLLVGFAPGGASDIVARLLAPSVSKTLGQPLVVANRPGANGNIANDLLAHAPPDGHTLLLTNNGSHVYNPLIYKSARIDPAKAFAPVTLLTATPLVVVVPQESTYRNLNDIIEAARKSPGAVTYGSAGSGAISHLVAATLAQRTETDMVHVPSKGSGQSIVDLLAGRLDFMADSRSPTMPFIRDGRLRPLAVTGSARVADLPDVPTVTETGIAELDMTAWLGIVAPAGTPEPVIEQLNAAFVAALREPEVAAQLEKLGTLSRGTSVVEFRDQLEREQSAAAVLIQRIGLSLE
jgi:tripartite-type tricarboxylate transporter receptor subunit TctC